MTNVEDTARDHMADRLYDIIIYRPGPTRAVELAEHLSGHIDVSAEFVTQVLDESPRFRAIHGMYDLTYRADLGSRPLGGAIAAVLDGFGRPMPRYLLASEMSHTRKGAPELFGDLLDDSLEQAGLGWVNEHYACSPDWIYEHMPNLQIERVLFLNALEDDEILAGVMEACTDESLGSRSLTDTAAAVLEAADVALSNRALGFLVGQHQGEKYDAAELLRQMLDDERFVPLCGPRWVLAEWVDELVESAASQSPRDENKEYDVDIEEVLAKDVPADKRYELTEDDVEAITAVVEHSRTPITIEGLLADVLQLTPNQHKYPRAAQAIAELLQGVSGLKKLSPGRYFRLGAVPNWARVVPKTLVPPRWEPEVDVEGELVTPDVLLQLEALDDEVVEDVQDPTYDDIGEKYIAPVTENTAPDAIHYPVINHHHDAGTMKIRVIDEPFFAEEDTLTMIELLCADGRILSAWLNKDTGLIYGLRAWYHDTLPPSGALITLEKTDQEGRYRLSWNEETDAQTYIGRETLDELEHWNERLARTHLSLRELVGVLLDDETGLYFNTLWAHLNMLRRVSRTQLGSVLSFYPAFEHGEGNRWYLNPDRRDEKYDEDRLDDVVGINEALEDAIAGGAHSDVDDEQDTDEE
ncbi:MAG: hypothetical protein R6V19_14665 [Armatimonadota bacterium]